jgi:hypothetical protein
MKNEGKDREGDGWGIGIKIVIYIRVREVYFPARELISDTKRSRGTD